MEIYFKIVGTLSRDNEILEYALKEFTMYPSNIPVSYNPSYDYRQYCVYKGKYQDGFLLSWRPTATGGNLNTEKTNFATDLNTKFGVSGITYTTVTNTIPPLTYREPDIFMHYEYGLYNNQY